jgi:hypothetical protein
MLRPFIESSVLDCPISLLSAESFLPGVRCDGDIAVALLGGGTVNDTGMVNRDRVGHRHDPSEAHYGQQTSQDERHDRGCLRADG